MGNEITEYTGKSINGYLNNPKVKANIVSVVGEKNIQTFTAAIVSATQANPQLKECTAGSILSAALLGESLKLPPSPQLGFCYIVPYKTEAQFQMSAKGYKQLAIRTGQYRKIVTSAIKQGELTFYNPITEEFGFEPVMDMEIREKLPTIGYYAMFELNNGFRKEIYWSRERMENHARRYSMSYKYDIEKKQSKSFWSKDFDGMAEKTMIRQLISKWGIMSVEMQKAFDGDMAVIREDGSAKYVDHDETKVEVESDIIESANTVDFKEAIDAN